ncbi:MAG: hypothetical protein OXC26_08575 [Albidovulum sp.]|nr:hypothetical protein [Albidovulum sp.]
MDYYQSVVAQWLVSDGRTLLAEEYYLRTSHVTEFKHSDQECLWPDMVAVRLNDKEVFLCEVTWSRGWSRIEEKLENYADRMPSIRESIECWLGIPQDFELRIWYFVPEGHIEKIKAKKPPGLKLDFTALEEIKPWTYTHGQRKA